MSSPADTAALDLLAVRAKVETEVAGFMRAQTPAVSSISDDLPAMLDIVGDAVSGGKRLRAIFLVVGWHGAGGSDCPELYRAAASMEFLQACALIHDDIMDDSDTRRGLPSTHRRFQDLHRAHGWHGSAERFGLGAAILAGDLCLSWADTCLLQSGLDPTALLRAKGAFDQMRAELMAGQYLDLVEQSRGGGDVARARTVIAYKSARYTIARPLEIGGRLAGGQDPLLRTYEAYGLSLGEAFQLRDDVLGIFGDAQQTGKPVGDDVREGKQTVLVATAMARASEADARVLRDALGQADLDADSVERLQHIIRDCGALAHVEQLIETGRDDAIAHANNVPGVAGVALRDLAVAATSRHA